MPGFNDFSYCEQTADPSTPDRNESDPPHRMTPSRELFHRVACLRFCCKYEHGVHITPECDVIDSFRHAAPSCQFPARAVALRGLLCRSCRRKPLHQHAAAAAGNIIALHRPPPTDFVRSADCCSYRHLGALATHGNPALGQSSGRFLQCSQCAESWNRVFRASCKTLRSQ